MNRPTTPSERAAAEARRLAQLRAARAAEIGRRQAAAKRRLVLTVLLLTASVGGWFAFGFGPGHPHGSVVVATANFGRERFIQVGLHANTEMNILGRSASTNALHIAAGLSRVSRWDRTALALGPAVVWGLRDATDPDDRPIRAADVTNGSAFQVIPHGIADQEHYLEEKAKAVVFMTRLDPTELTVSPERRDWNYDGIVAYSKVCTHVGCPVALYEQQTHHLLCPCHQSTFDVANEAKVVFGPAKRALPQLPITVDTEGYLVARSDFHEPIGPSFWERER